MGQAKRRGTFKQRRDAAILRDNELKQKRENEPAVIGCGNRSHISPLLVVASLLAASGYYDYGPVHKYYRQRKNHPERSDRVDCPVGLSYAARKAYYEKKTNLFL